MSTRHRWADVITAWAEGEAVQWQALYDETRDIWVDWNAPDITPQFCDKNLIWRIKPRMCSLNGHEFPAPERKPPEHESEYWIPVHDGGARLARAWPWNNDGADRRFLKHGRVHLTKDAAIAHARAEILAVGGTLEDES